MFVKVPLLGGEALWSRRPESEGEKREEEKIARKPSYCWRVTAFYLQIPGNKCSSTKLRGMRRLERGACTL